MGPAGSTGRPPTSPTERWGNRSILSSLEGQSSSARRLTRARQETCMNNIIYLVGLIVVVIAVLSFFGLR